LLVKKILFAKRLELSKWLEHWSWQSFYPLPLNHGKGIKWVQV